MARSIFSAALSGLEQVRAAALAMKSLDSRTKSNINRFTKSEMGPSWKPAVSEQVHAGRLSAVDHVVLSDQAKVTASGSSIRLQSAQKGPSGWNPKYDPAMFEFGTGDRDKVTVYERDTRHGSQTVHRHASRQLPQRIKKGRVVYPAARLFIPRIASLWVQTIVRTYYETFEE